MGNDPTIINLKPTHIKGSDCYRNQTRFEIARIIETTLINNPKSSKLTLRIVGHLSLQNAKRLPILKQPFV